MEWEALLLGLEPLTVAAVGIGVAVAAPVVAAIDSATGSQFSESARTATKQGLIFAFQALETMQSAIAEAQESVNDLMAEAKNDFNQAKQKTAETGVENGVENGNIPVEPHSVEIN